MMSNLEFIERYRDDIMYENFSENDATFLKLVYIE